MLKHNIPRRPTNELLDETHLAAFEQHQNVVSHEIDVLLPEVLRVINIKDINIKDINIKDNIIIR